MIAGQGMTECLFLVEPDWDKLDDREEGGDFIDTIWDIVESANKQGPSRPYIEKDRIRSASREKSFQFNAEGTLRRTLVCKDYASEILALGSDDTVDLGGSSSVFRFTAPQTCRRHRLLRCWIRHSSGDSHGTEHSRRHQGRGTHDEVWGYWNPDEWFPALVFTSNPMAIVPESLGMPVEWIPVNTPAQIVLEIIQFGNESKHCTPAKVMILVNPRRTSWTSLLPKIQSRIGANAVILQSWLGHLAKRIPCNVENRPAYKLPGFYERLAHRDGHDSFPQLPAAPNRQGQ
ncbi:hypothetical protein BDV33DRAFT_211002 [Aspergillus novoparasiticus]|uniref:Uncharacterized protein n=1 Tax=Aspergillus novoparasiticus TaxID=986946 RepID=A0A5N6E621_9EURO|nr:hypothetical protein BDV33DRAFT_211002 [Aspergillus novoparasiticus]